MARDETFLTQELVPACLRFWALIAERKAPLLDPVRDLYVPVGEELDHWAVLAGAYRDLLRDKARLEGHLKETTGEMTRLEHALVGMMGGFLTAEAAGLKVTRYQQSGAIDYAKALKAVLPELDPSQLESYRRKPSERVRITRARGGDRHRSLRRAGGGCLLAAGGERVVLLLMLDPVTGRLRPSRLRADGPPEGVFWFPGEDRPSFGLFGLSVCDSRHGASWAL